MDFRQVTPDSIKYLQSASVAVQARFYIKLTKLHRVASQNVWFNQQCKRFNVIPNYINIHSNTTSPAAGLAIRKAQKVWLDAESRRWFAIRDNLKLHIKILHTELSHNLHSVEFDLLDQKARDLASQTIHYKFINQSHKLQRLRVTQHGGSNVGRHSRNNNGRIGDGHSFYPRVENLTNVQFSQSEVSLLEKGLKYNITPKLTSSLVEGLAVDSEVAIVINKKDNMVKGVVTNELNKIQPTNCGGPELRTVRSLQQKIDNNDLIVTKADKGNSIVILNKDEYINKVQDIIHSDDFIPLRSDPTTRYNTEVKNNINHCKFLFPNDYSSRLITPMNPQAPVLYGLPKIHKDNVPVRPVVSYIGCPAYELAKKLNDIIKEKSSFYPKYSIQNTADLIAKIRDVILPPNSIFLSLDVDSLFTNVPYQETLKILSNILERRRIHPGEANEIVHLTNICMQQNYFKFNGGYYKQKEGLAMGSPLSPLMAEIFMDNFENRYFTGNNNILYYYRYVDDILICWTGTRQELESFYSFVNNLHPKIKFKLEVEVDNSINFLDLTITREHCRHNFQIYRKPTHTDVVIPAASCHPWQHKLAAFHSYINRLLTVPLSNESYMKELNTIYNIAVANGYDRRMIDKLVKTKINKQMAKLLYAVPRERVVHTYRSSMIYVGKISEKISKILRNNDVHVAFRTTNTVRRAICNGKEKTEVGRKSGVYRLTCDECNSVYVGQTGRCFETRYKEHISAYRNARPERSHFAEHLLDTGHQLSDGHSYEVLHTCNKSLRLNVLEQLEIIKHNVDGAILNDQINVSSSPLLRICRQTNSDRDS